MTEADSNKYLDSKRCVVHTVYEMRLRAVVLRSYRVGWCKSGMTIWHIPWDCDFLLHQQGETLGKLMTRKMIARD